MRNLSLGTAALLVASAAVRHYLVCAPPGLPPAAQNASLTVVVQTNTSVAPFLCTSAAAGGCALGAPAVHACGFLLGGGATSYITIAADVPAAVFAFMATQPFSWHVLTSAAPVRVALPTGDVSLGAPSTLLCDSSADCPAGVACVAASGTCAALVPSPSASPAPPARVPSPTAGPAAALCNLTGTWLQSSLSPTDHSADATIEIVSDPHGAGLTFACKKGRGTCPGGLPSLNGTGVLSAVDNSLVLTPAPGSGVAALGGVINNTLPCGGGSQPAALALLTGGTGAAGAVEWARKAAPLPPVLDTTVSVATFLGGGERQFVSTGIAILSAGGDAGAASAAVLVAAGNGGAAFGALTPVALFGAAPDANGTLVLLSVSAAGGLVPAGVLKLGARVDHVRANARGDVAVVGSFGVAVLTGLLANPGAAPAVAWHDDLARLQPGPCGVCCSSAAATCRVDIGDDGVVAVDYRVLSAEGWLWGAYDAAGAPLAQQAIEGADITAVVVDAARQQVMVATFRDDNTGREPMVMPRVEAFSYAARAAQLAQAWVDFPWSARVYRTPGPCDGNVADGRVLALRLGGDGTLLVGGRSDGGNSPFFCGMRNASRITPFAQIDAFTEGYNMAAQAVTNFVRVDPATGEAIVGQLQLTRLPSSGKGNSLFTLAAHADAAGAVYLLQAAGCCIADMANLTVNGQPTAANVDATVLHVLDSSLSRRHTWTHFVAAGSTSGGGAPVDVDVRGGLVALAMTTAAQMVTVLPLPGTGAAAAGGAPVGFVVVLPTLAAAAAAAAGGGLAPPLGGL